MPRGPEERPPLTKATEKAAVDRLAALLEAIDTARRGGTISISAHVRRWTDEIVPLLEGDEDPLGVDDLTTHRLPLADAPSAYSMFQKKEDGAIKVVLKP